MQGKMGIETRNIIGDSNKAYGFIWLLFLF
jgi:hypothetical protein